jgi:ribosomal protein S8
MVLPYDLCARMQNAFRSRHRDIGVMHSVQHLGILSILLRAGFLSSISRGTIEGPDPVAFHDMPASKQRIWATLKYRDDRPVLSNMELISKPSNKVHFDISEIRRLCSGRTAQMVKPLAMGEVAVVRTAVKEHEWLEARDALRLGLPGEMICRAR